MANTVRYGKPKMTDLPKDLGRSIIKTIMNTPASDSKKTQEKANEIEARIVAARKEKFYTATDQTGIKGNRD